MNHNTLGQSRAVARTGMVALCLFALAACGTKPSRPDGAAEATPRLSPEDAVKLRATQRWGYMIERRFDKAWEMLSPGYREVQPQEAYVSTMKDRPVQWTRVHFQKAECQPEVCKVEIMVNAQFQMPVMRVGTVDALNVITESWILSDGEWYLVPSADR